MLGPLIVFGITYVLIASEKVEKGIAALLGASAMILLHFVPYEDALHHIDQNVIFLLVGMMMIVNVMGKTGLFEWLAVTVAQLARGNGVVVLLLLLAVTAVLSAFLDNVTTIILIAPITILLTQILEVPPVPFLVLEAIFSNIGGTATLVGDPPNVLIGSQEHISFNAFLVDLGPIILLTTLVSLALVALVLRKQVIVRQVAKERIMKARADLAITDPRRLKVCLGVFALVLAGFFLGPVMHVEPGIVALAGGVLMTLLCRLEMHHVMEKVEWGTIFFFIGLFMLVGALQEAGVFLWLGKALTRATRGNLLLTTVGILWVSAVTSAIVDNIPLVIAMIPLIDSIVPTFATQMGLTGSPELIVAQISTPLFWALALGACLGGNGTLVGASANVVISQIARKNGYKISFWRFTRTGLPIMALSLVFSTGYLYLRYFAFETATPTPTAEVQAPDKPRAPDKPQAPPAPGKDTAEPGKPDQAAGKTAPTRSRAALAPIGPARPRVEPADLPAG